MDLENSEAEHQVDEKLTEHMQIFFNLNYNNNCIIMTNNNITEKSSINIMHPDNYIDTKDIRPIENKLI